ncbi:hypothetical protein F5Y15DRAFT_158196 [Xylariaceae sp. FL0016]|nr:hypothetical protein F5Y15DRAFT_158196 [Xylariaceae sp. FL0016]
MAEFAAIGLASNILQFAGSVSNVIVKYRRLYKSTTGATAENADLEADTETLRAVASELGQSSSTSKGANNAPWGKSRSELRLQSLAKQCSESATELIEILDDLKLRNDGYRRLHAVRKLFSIEKKREKIDRLENRVSRLQDVLTLEMITIIIDKQSDYQIELQDSEASITERLRDIRVDIQALLEKLEVDIKGDASQEPRSESAVSKDQSIQQVMTMFKSLQGETITAKKQQRLLTSLNFKSIRRRELTIKKAHAETFKWLFSPPTDDFAEWLRSGQGIYWICGKAGSGKSTLMRFLSQYDGTMAALKAWASDKQLIFGSHYFWNAGSSMQKSRRGLLQTLLFQVFRQCPDLIRTCCPHRWDSSNDLDDDAWDEEELHGALEALSHESISPAKFFFLIDGLDEYTDGMENYRKSFDELIEPLKRFSESPDIKICVSSRPWHQFEDAFGKQNAKLRLETLTRPDIERYVKDKLNTDSDSRCRKLVDIIVNRSKGVFLWVSLVVESILNGVSAEDTYEDLKLRLDRMPDDLEEYFRHMLRSIEPFYWDQAVSIFQTTIHCEWTLPLLAYEFLDQERENGNYALELPIGYQVDIKRVHERMKKRLNVRCKDLLEITVDPEEPTYMRHKVDFLHRTVKDFFLDTDAVTDVIKERRTAPFDVLLSLCRVMLALLKVARSPEPTREETLQILNVTEKLFYYAWRMETKTCACLGRMTDRLSDKMMRHVFQLLDEVDLVNSKVLSKENGHWTNVWTDDERDYRDHGHKTFLAKAIQRRLMLYTVYRLEKRPSEIRKEGRPLIDYAPRSDAYATDDSPYIDKRPDPQILEFLLAKRADPNQKVRTHSDQTPWGLCLRLYSAHRDSVASDAIMRDIYRALKLMLAYGADPGIIVTGRLPEEPSQVKLTDAIEAIGLSRQEVKDLKDLINEKRSQFTYWLTWSHWVSWLSLSIDQSQGKREDSEDQRLRDIDNSRWYVKYHLNNFGIRKSRDVRSAAPQVSRTKE